MISSGSNFFQRRDDDAPHGVQVAVVAGAGQHRHINVAACPGAFTAIPFAGIARREAAVLMQRQRQHVAVLPIDVLGAVAVVHVPVEYRHLAEAMAGLGALDSDGNIGQEAEAHRLIRQAVVARRTRQRIGVIQLALQHRLHRRAGQPGGELGDFIAARPQRRFLSQQAAAAVAHLFETLQVVGGVNAQQVFFRRRFGAQQGEPARQAGHVHQVLHAPFGFRRLGVAGARKAVAPSRRPAGWWRAGRCCARNSAHQTRNRLFFSPFSSCYTARSAR